jgi:hypothetical protein
MKIYLESDKSQSLYHRTTGLLGLPINDSTTITKEDFIQSANVWYRDINEWIWKNQNTWQFDDSNYDKLPIGKADIVDDKQEYTLPTSVFDIKGVEILDKNGDKVLLHPVDKLDSQMDIHGEKGLPQYYSLVSNVLRLYPKPDASEVTLDDGLLIYAQRDIDQFEVTDSTKEPGIPAQFHDIIAMGVARDKSISFGMPDLFTKLSQILNEKKADLEKHFNRRHRNVRRRITPSAQTNI